MRCSRYRAKELVTKDSNTEKIRAFTLIELLVVVSIISLLVSILLPSLGKARDAAKEVVCMTNLKSIGTGFVMYENDFGRFPKELHVDWFGPINLWQGQVLGSIGGERRDSFTYATGDWTGDQIGYPDRQSKVFECQRDKKQSYWFGNTNGYGINRYLWIDDSISAFFSIKELENPSSTFLVMDSDYYLVYDGLTAYGTTHRGKKNVLYCDVHVEEGYREEDVYWDESDLWGDTYYAWMITP